MSGILTLRSLQHVPDWEWPNHAYRIGGEDMRDEAFEAICDAIAAGHMLTAICRDLGWGPSVLHRWKERKPERKALYEAAKEAGYDAIAEDTVLIADGLRPVPGVRSDAGRDRTRTDVRLKLLAKWNPRKYGERVQLADANGEKLTLAPLVADVMGLLRGRNAEPLEITSVQTLPAPEASQDASDLV